MEATAQMPRTTSSARLRGVLAAALFLAAPVALAAGYHALPLMIHSPFNHGGNAAGLASRSQLWLLLMIGGWIYVLMSMVNLLGPEAVNGPASLTTEQRMLLAARAKAVIGWAKVAAMAGQLLWVGAYLIR